MIRHLAWIGVPVGLLIGLSACADGETVGENAPVNQADLRRASNDAKPDASRNPTAGRSGPLPGGATSCVEVYAPAAVSQRAFAFDGVVLEVGPSVSDRGDEADLNLPGVTFEVREWFSGNPGSDTVTVDVPSATTRSEDSSDPGYALGPGSRLLVSGESRWGGSSLESPIAWGCGFSRYYDARTAKAWRSAFGR